MAISEPDAGAEDETRDAHRIAGLRQQQIANEMLGKLLDGIATHCKHVADQLEKASD